MKNDVHRSVIAVFDPRTELPLILAFVMIAVESALRLSVDIFVVSI